MEDGHASEVAEPHPSLAQPVVVRVSRLARDSTVLRHQLVLPNGRANYILTFDPCKMNVNLTLINVNYNITFYYQ